MIVCLCEQRQCPGWVESEGCGAEILPPTHPYLLVYCLAQLPGVDLASVRQVLPSCCPVLIHVEKKGSVLQECRVSVLLVGFAIRWP